MQWTDI